MNASLPHKERLREKIIIDKLFSEGKTINAFPLKLVYLPIENKINKVAFIAPKRTLKKAVERNAVKRVLRENYRLQKEVFFNNIQANFAFAILYLGKEIPEFHFIEKKMKVLFHKLQKVQSNDGQS